MIQIEASVIIRWVLRFALVGLLVWLFKSKQEQEEEQEEETDEPEQDKNGKGQTFRGQQRNADRYGEASARANGLKDRRQAAGLPTSGALRQRQGSNGFERSGSGGGRGGDIDFDAVINKVSKPKTLWKMEKPNQKPGGGEWASKEETTPAGSPTIGGCYGEPTPTENGHGRPEGKMLKLAPKAEAKMKAGDKDKPPSQREVPSAKLAKPTLHGHERPVTFITWNRDGNLIFTCGKDKVVNAWSFPSGELLGSYNGHNGAVWACSITSDSKWLATSAADQRVIVWEAVEARELARVELPGVARCVEWAGASGPGGKASERFVTAHNKFGSNPPALHIYNFDGETIQEVQKISGLPTPATQVRWGRDDEVLASSHDNGELVFWSTNGSEIGRLAAHKEAILKFDFSSDRQLVATASFDTFVKVWRDCGTSASWELIYQFQCDRSLNAVALVPSLTCSLATGAVDKRPEGCAVIAGGGQDARDVALKSQGGDQFGALLFRLGAGAEFPNVLQPVGVTKGHFGPIHVLAFSRDGTAFASGSEDGIVRLHIFDPNLPLVPDAIPPAQPPSASET